MFFKKLLHYLLTSALLWNLGSVLLFLLIIAGVVVINTLGTSAKITPIIIGIFFFDLYYLGLARYYQIKIWGLLKPKPIGKNMLNHLMVFLAILGIYGYVQGAFKPARPWFLLSILAILLSKLLVSYFTSQMTAK